MRGQARLAVARIVLCHYGLSILSSPGLTKTSEAPSRTEGKRSAVVGPGAQPGSRHGGRDTIKMKLFLTTATHTRHPHLSSPDLIETSEAPS
jgi:hypothetical protein